MPAKKKYQKPEAKPPTDSNQNLIADMFPNMKERTEADSAYFPDSQFAPYNPDDLFQKRNDYYYYDEMLKDDQVSVCASIKRDLVVGTGWSVISEEDDEQHQIIQEDIERALSEDTELPFDDQLEEIISAYNYGFSVSEKVFKYRPDGALTLKYIKTRHPSTWLLHTDRQGNVVKYQQQGVMGNFDINPKSLIHYVNNPGWGNPYGLSDLRAAYTAWFVKTQIIRYYGIFIEKAASPTPVAKYDKNAPQSAVNDIHDAIKKLQVKTALTIPKDIEIDFLQTNDKGEAFTKGINIFNMFIGRSLLIPDLLGFQGDETSGGSYALGKDQMDILFKHVERRRSTLESMINKHIVWPIVVANHGFVPNYPKFKLNSISDEKAVELAKLWIEAMKGKLYKPTEQEINRLRELVGFPTGDVEILEPQPSTPPMPFKEKENPQVVDKPVDKVETFASVYAPAKGDFSNKTDFKAIKNNMESFRERLLAEAAPIVNKIYEDLFDQLERKRILQTQNAEKLETISLKHLKELKQMLKKNLRGAYKDGQILGQKELLKSNFATPLPDDKFLEFLDSQTFEFVGDWAYNVSKKAKQEMRQAIRDGKPLSHVIDVLEEDGKKAAQNSIERYARTAHTDVINRGRQAFFNETGMVAAYQYSAILDDRTTDICRGLHGKIFKNGTEPVPPMHFNCRSVLVPITVFEEFTPDKKVGKQDINSFIEENKGKGFPKR